MGQKTDGSVPNITGGVASVLDSGYSVSGAFYKGAGSSWTGHTQNGGNNIYFDASRSSSVYTNGQTRVKSAGLYVMYCVKY